MDGESFDQRGCPVAINRCLSIFVHDGGESTTDDGRESTIDEDSTSMLFGVFK